MALKKGKIFAGLCFFMLIFSFACVLGADETSFDVNSLLLKVSVKSGDSVNKVLTISRGSNEQVNLEVVSVPGLKLTETSFVLSSDGSKNIPLSFNSYGLETGVYVGSIKISDSKKVSYVPVIFEVESQDVFYDINLDISPQYSSISPGEKLVVQLKIFDLVSGGVSAGLGVNTINIDYYVYDISGKVISSETESVAIDKQAQITKAVPFSKGAKEGDYVFVAVAKYRSSLGAASYLFSVKKSDSSSGTGISLFSGNVDWKFISIIGGGILAVIVLVVLIALLFIYMVRDRNQFVSELKRYNESELKKQKELLLEQQRILLKEGIPEKKIKSEMDARMEKLKETHRERIEKMNKLEKTGNIKEMKKRLDEWKHKGYNLFPLEFFGSRARRSEQSFFEPPKASEKRGLSKREVEEVQEEIKKRTKSKIDARMERLREKHRERIEKMRMIRRRKHAKEMNKQLNRWRSKGYNLFPLELFGNKPKKED